jgi:hypothetical protein
VTVTDFPSAELYTIKGLVTYYNQFFIDIGTQSV